MQVDVGQLRGRSELKEFFGTPLRRAVLAVGLRGVVQTCAHSGAYAHQGEQAEHSALYKGHVFTVS
jgi:hypothetical protein